MCHSPQMTNAAFQAEMTRRGYSEVGTVCKCGRVVTEKIRSLSPELCSFCHIAKVYAESPMADKGTA